MSINMKVVQLPSGAWISEQEQKVWNKTSKRMRWNQQYLLWGYPQDVLEKREIRRARRDEAVMWAYIMVGKTMKRAMVTEDMQRAYKLDGYSRTNMQWSKFSFLRWINMMEV